MSANIATYSTQPKSMLQNLGRFEPCCQQVPGGMWLDGCKVVALLRDLLDEPDTLKTH